MTTRPAADRLLGHLGLEREPPTLDYLHALVRAHQLRVPFETLTKLIDHAPGLARGDFLPPFELYVERIVKRGAGGLCWTLARGFRVLLADLGFEAALMIMEPGHCCVRVERPEGSFYADVGFAAPLFRAYPLFESFTADTHREKFDYRVREDGIFVTRNPGPTKKLDPTPRTEAELRGRICAANDWSARDSFLRRIAFAAYVDGVYASLNNGMLRTYRPEGMETRQLVGAEVREVVAGLFGADPKLYDEAVAAQRWLAAGEA